MGSGVVLDDLLYMHFHLPKQGRRYRACNGLVGEQGYALLNAERLEDRL
jgi:hypothetical protein